MLSALCTMIFEMGLTDMRRIIICNVCNCVDFSTNGIRQMFTVQLAK